MSPINLADPEADSGKIQLQMSEATQQLLDMEAQYTAGGFAPLPVFMDKGLGARLWDVDGKEYLDFICMFSAINQGHSHPKIIQAMAAQLQKAYLLNIATHTSRWPPFAKSLCNRVGYDQVSAMVSGGEGSDLATKIARKWGHKVKQIPTQDLLVLGVGGSYHGLGSGVWGLQDPSAKRAAYGLDSPRQTNVNPTTGQVLQFGNIRLMEECLREHHTRTAAVIMECIRNTGNTYEEEVNYSRGVYDLCKKYGILFIADEVRMGCGKTGKFFSFHHLGDDVKPDLVVMGKSVSGGAYPASFVLGPKEIMGLVHAYETAATFCHTPLAIAACEAALEIIDEENLVERAAVIGRKFTAMTADLKSHPYVTKIEVRGADFNVGILEDTAKGITARRLAGLILTKGVLLYPLEGRLRMSVPMVMTDEELERGIQTIKDAINELPGYGAIPGEAYHKD